MESKDYNLIALMSQASFRWLLAPTHTLAQSLHEEDQITLIDFARVSKLLFRLSPSHNSFTNSPMNLA
jgi:hypothetical protein